MTWLEQMRADNQAFRESMRADNEVFRASMRADNEAFRVAVRADLAEFRQEYLTALQATELRLVDRIHAVDQRVAKTKADLMKWSFVFWVGAVAAIAILAGVLRQ